MTQARKNGWRLTSDWMNGGKYPKPVPYIPDLTKPRAVIVDIDGTIALHGDERGHYEYEKVATDTVNHPVAWLVDLLDTEVDIIFLSGREDRCRDDTVNWLNQKLGYGQPKLFMRTTGDHRPDYVIKGELFDAYIRDNYNVQFVLDDRDQVVNMWRGMGLTCLQVAEGNF